MCFLLRGSVLEGAYTITTEYYIGDETDATYAIGVGDLNMDGIMDIVSGNDGETNKVRTRSVWLGGGVVSGHKAHTAAGSAARTAGQPTARRTHFYQVYLGELDEASYSVKDAGTFIIGELAVSPHPATFCPSLPHATHPIPPYPDLPQPYSTPPQAAANYHKLPQATANYQKHLLQMSTNFAPPRSASSFPFAPADPTQHQPHPTPTQPPTPP